MINTLLKVVAEQNKEADDNFDRKHKNTENETIFEEFDGSTRYSIIKGVFYIADLHSKHLAYKVMKHVKYEKPIIEYTFKKVQAQAVMKDLMKA